MKAAPARGAWRTDHFWVRLARAARIIPWLLAAVAFAVVARHLLLTPAIPLDNQPVPDAQEYAVSAYRLAHGQGFTIDATIKEVPTHPPGVNPPRFPPGLPLLLAPFTLSGQFPDDAQFGARTVAIGYLLVMTLAAAFLAGSWAALLVTLLVGISPFVESSAKLVMSDALSAALGVALLPFLLRRSVRSAALAGLIGGFAIAVRLEAVIPLAVFFALLPGSRRRLATVVAAGLPVGLLAIWQWVTFGRPWGTGNDYWLHGVLRNFDFGYITRTSRFAEGPWIYPDRLSGALAQWACAPHCGPSPLAVLPNILFYTLVVAGVFWIFAPPFVSGLGVVVSVLWWRDLAARMALLSTAAAFMLHIAYVGQGARFLAASVSMLIVVACVPLRRLPWSEWPVSARPADAREAPAV